MDFVLDVNLYDAAIFDLDGVVTKTAEIHAEAWRRLFSDFLLRYAPSVRPYSDPEDYILYIDGKPRALGLASFLQSRNLFLSKTARDELLEKKSQLFLEILEEKGGKSDEHTLHFIERLKKNGLQIGLISASENCYAILNRLGIPKCFTEIVEGTIAKSLHLAGKPDPDIFLEMAKRLSISPERIFIVEDALAGVQAGKAGGFGLVIAIGTREREFLLRSMKADVVVENLESIRLKETKPSALANFEKIASLFKSKKALFFLDYDGTLTPTATHPDLAFLSTSMREILEKLSKRYRVIIVSGRDRLDVEKKVGLKDLIYVGSYGLDISMPDGKSFEYKENGEGFLKIEPVLQEALKTIPGAWVERKKYSVAVHFRALTIELEKEMEESVDRCLESFPTLRKMKGKNVFEIRPIFDWDMGKALRWILEKLELKSEDSFPIYIGDDVTDEESFQAVRSCGLGIAVQEKMQVTAARYMLRDPLEVEQFLQKMLISS